MITKHLINSIYRATEGEGVFLGRPQIFVRYQGCAIGCLNCDSKDTWDFTEDMGQSLEMVLEAIHNEGFNGAIKNVSITGGDPLHPAHVPHVLALVKILKQKKYYVNLEAAGTRVVDEIFDLVDYVSFDFKTPSTGVKTPLKNISKMIAQYPGKFQVKAVIADQVDFSATIEAFKTLENEKAGMPFPWVLTPCFNNNEEFPLQRFSDVLKWNEEAGGFFRVIGQQHKWIFGPDQKQV
ncbi:MAG: 7-carboxy-7-deazaguanine synthase QueE [Bacteriovorax sp.]|nr:7-carboxy-7-deazaguanine synthase QueE [Bacteriovorax sp.]